jgi:Outer membrane protein beta-barrel domain
MKRTKVVLIACLMLTAAVSARAQVSESAIGRGLKVYGGGEVSVFQPDYAGQGIAQTGPQRLYGIGGYVDANFTRWIQIEAEGRWLHWNQYAGISQNTYMIGPRVPIVTYKGFTPYGKFLFGMASGSFLTGRTAAFAYGGGVDYRLGNKFMLRAFDFEYQDWRVTPTLHPYGGSVGISYRIF